MSSKMTKPSSVCEISVEKRWNKLISKSATRRNTPPLEELARNQRYLWLQEDFIISRLHINRAAFGLPTHVYHYDSIWSSAKREFHVFLCPRPTTFQLFTTHRPICLSSDISWGEKCRIIFGDIRVIRANTSPSLSLIFMYFHWFSLVLMGF